MGGAPARVRSPQPLAAVAALVVGARSVPDPPYSCSGPHGDGRRTGRTTGATEGRAYPCSSWILRLVDGLSRRAPARHRLQFHPARLRSAAARGSALSQAACLPVLCNRLGFQPPAHPPQLPFHALRKNYRATSWCRSRGFLADTCSPSRGRPPAVLSPLCRTPASGEGLSLPYRGLRRAS